MHAFNNNKRDTEQGLVLQVGAEGLSIEKAKMVLFSLS